MSAIDHYDVVIRRPGKPVDRDAISSVEQELALIFPQPYVDFLLANNGGSPSQAYLPGPGQGGGKVERFYSLGDNGLVQTCQRLRADHGLPTEYLPIALVNGESPLLVKCSGEEAGSLYCWFDLEEGFRYEDPDYSNVKRLYFDIAELPRKFGPAKNRKDRDGMYFQLYYASSNPRHGGIMAEKFVEEGYDINFVVPTFWHPIFGAINSEVFGVAVTLLKLGTHATHVDSRYENATIEVRLLDAQQHWNMLLEHSRETKYDTGKRMAARHLSDIASALALIRGVATTSLTVDTPTKHIDLLHEMTSLEENLLEAQERWRRLLESSCETDDDTGKQMATRHLSDIAGALAIIRGTQS
jgi:hypothetical protein